MFFQSLLEIARLNFGFFIGLALGNLFWVFAIYALTHYFVGVKTVYSFVVIMLNLWILGTWASIAGVMAFVGGFFLLNYISKLTALKLSEGNKFLQPRMIWVNELQAWTVFILFSATVVLGL